MKKTYKITQLPEMEHITINGVKYVTEPEFSITKEQILELYKIKSSLDKNFDIMKLFPEAFKEEKVELPKDFTGWCKIDDDRGNDDWLMYFKKGIQKFGFDSEANYWTASGIATIKSYYRQEDQQEAQEALEKEAVRKGFVVGVYFKEPTLSEPKICYGEIKICNSMDDGDFGLQFGSGNGLIMKNGIWAEIIPTLTIKEAEEKLNCKIV